MIILASGSPRRRELLTLAGYEFKVVKSDFDEESVNITDPYELVKVLAYNKAMTIAKDYPNDIILAADTTVILKDQILNKPSDEQDAFNMLRALCSAKKHVVATGVCIINNKNVISFVEKTKVEFYDLSDEEIKAYVDTKEPMDKAGAYGIQGRGCILVRKINGDYYNVMGLPIARINKILKKYR
jgi:septum formation protein